MAVATYIQVCPTFLQKPYTYETFSKAIKSCKRSCKSWKTLTRTQRIGRKRMKWISRPTINSTLVCDEFLTTEQFPITHFHLALIYLLSSASEKITFRELVFILQVSPELAVDPLVPYLFSNDQDGHKQLRTYLMARFLTPEIFKNGPSLSTALALLSN